MLIKEYRIPLPLSVEEYRIAQLFMIQKKSRIESSGAGSGVEIIKNEPYENGSTGGNGQYTYKIYHIGSRIPLWIRNILPSSALEAHEESWNAYPYTRTRYSCPLISNFSVEVETRYFDDCGSRENVFNLNKDELKNRVIDLIDFVRDPISSHDYCAEEDPKLYRSEKTGRGPLNDGWLSENVASGRSMMCAYKLCKVEFKYWGLQTRGERWIHELALRGTMLRAHRQAWVWQDEWHGLTIEDIRRLEHETKEYLAALMSSPEETARQQSNSEGVSENELNVGSHQNFLIGGAESLDYDEEEEEEEEDLEKELSRGEKQQQKVGVDVFGARSLSCSNSEADIFFDCSDKVAEDEEEGGGENGANQREQRATLVRWSSELLVNEEENEKSPPRTPRSNNNRSLLILVFHGDLFPSSSADSKITDTNTLRSTLESIISSHYSQLKNRVHVLCVTCGSELESLAKLLLGLLCSSSGTFHPSIGQLLASDVGAFNAAITQTIATANQVFRTFLSSDAGRAFDECGEGSEIFLVGDFVGGLLMYEALASSSAAAAAAGIAASGSYLSDAPLISCRSERVNSHSSPLDKNSSSSNSRSKSPTTTYLTSSSARSSPLPVGGKQNVCKENISASQLFKPLSAGASESPGQIFNFDGKVRRECSPTPSLLVEKQKSAPPSARRQASNSSQEPSSILKKQSLRSNDALAFQPSAAFLLGCPLALLLTQRHLMNYHHHNLSIACEQLFNLYYPIDLCGARLEPVLNPNLAQLQAPRVPHYQRFHLLGDGHDIHFDSGFATPMVWGSRRVDHELYCPPEMNALPALTLPNILHASYWESKDVGAFILRQFLRFDEIPGSILTLKNLADQPPLQFQMPSAIWNRRRTRFKIANLAANHRANDLLVLEDAEQQICARFCYGPMDLVALSQENVLVYVLPSGGEWSFRGIETTDKHGRLTINLGKSLPEGIHHVRLIVQGDHTFLSVSIAVVPRGTPLVVFSIDGSLTASVSVTGRDPRLKPGAVDVVRFWQQQGYLIIYLTARPDMQQRLVCAWLATHNFPHGLLFFTPSLSTEPLKQKMQFMRHLTDIGLCVQAAYGSAKDIPVYSNAGLDSERIFKMGSGHRRKHTADCVSLENGYSSHLHDLHSGRIKIAQPAEYITGGITLSSRGKFAAAGQSFDEAPATEKGVVSGGHAQRSPMQRTLSFGPRTGKYSCSKKISQASSLSTNY